MTFSLPARGFAAALLASVLMLPSVSTETAANEAVSKDTGPARAACDALARGTDDWRACVGAARAAMPDEELFYAGYWLAKSGHYAEALTYLNLARVKDERVLTYIGFATRKLGAVEAALSFYRSALTRNPNYVVARAYLGEAYLSQGEPARAKAELAEIAARCGTSCPAYIDLDRHIAEYVAAHG